MNTYVAECVDRSTGRSYTVYAKAMDAAEAMQKVSRTHVVGRVSLTDDDATPVAPTAEKDMAAMPPQVADAESVRLLREIDASLKTLLEKRLPSRLGQSDLAVAVGLGVVLSIPIGIVLSSLLLALVAGVLKILP